jgi:hypothetical protein
MSQGGFGGGPAGPAGHDPFGSSPFTNDPFTGVPNNPGAPGFPPGRPTHVPPPPPGPPRQESNTLATLSVIFAFVFAPAGAVLGHLGLSQIGRTGQAGRERALVGLTLSYVVIVVAVVAVTVWTVTDGNTDTSSTVANSPTKTTVATTTAPTTTASPAPPLPPPPPPPVDAAGLPALLLPLDEMKSLTGDLGLTMIEEWSDVELPNADESVYEPADCMGSFLAGVPPAYQGSGYRTFHANVPGDRGTLLHIVQGVATFDDDAAAQKALAGYVAQWTRCAGTTLNWLMMKKRATAPITLGAPQDAGAGITTLRNLSSLDGIPYLRAIAAKNNVLVDVQVSGGDHVPDRPVVIVNAILDRIPG